MQTQIDNLNQVLLISPIENMDDLAEDHSALPYNTRKAEKLLSEINNYIDLRSEEENAFIRSVFRKTVPTPQKFQLYVESIKTFSPKQKPMLQGTAIGVCLLDSTVLDEYKFIDERGDRSAKLIETQMDILLAYKNPRGFYFGYLLCKGFHCSEKCPGNPICIDKEKRTQIEVLNAWKTQKKLFEALNVTHAAQLHDLGLILEYFYSLAKTNLVIHANLRVSEIESLF